MSRDAFIFDAIRTPRGRGKTDGSLHEVPTVRLAAFKGARSGCFASSMGVGTVTM